MEKIISSLLKNGGKEWGKGDIKRIYFSKDIFIKFCAELNFSCYFVGGVHDAIKRISTADESCKAWFDINSKEFCSKKIINKSVF